MANERTVTALKALHAPIEEVKSAVLVIPEGFPDAENIRKNVARFLEKGGTRVAHLIMLIHDQERKIG